MIKAALHVHLSEPLFIHLEMGLLSSGAAVRMKQVCVMLVVRSVSCVPHSAHREDSSVKTPRPTRPLHQPADSCGGHQAGWLTVLGGPFFFMCRKFCCITSTEAT